MRTATRAQLTRSLGRWGKAVVDVRRLGMAAPQLFGFARDWMRYRRLAGSAGAPAGDLQPCLWDRTGNHPWDPHYVLQALWAFRRIQAAGMGHHVDVGSAVDYVALLTTVTRVTFVDVRPLPLVVPGFAMVQASLLSLPFGDASIPSLSSLHVVEHVGLGRYGDPLDPDGTRKALRELVRVLARGGDLYLSLPVGRARTCFNAHRIHQPAAVLAAVPGLELVEFSAVDDGGRLVEKCPLDALDGADYACGLFHVRKP